MIGLSRMNMMTRRFAMTVAAGASVLGATTALALDCNCSKTVASCTASLKADAQWFYFRSNSNSCSDIRYHFKTSTSSNDYAYPQQITITNGEAQQAWTGQGRVTAITVDSCTVCASESSNTVRQSSSSVKTCAAIKAEIIAGLDATTLSSPEAMAFINQQVEKKRDTGDCR